MTIQLKAQTFSQIRETDIPLAFFTHEDAGPAGAAVLSSATRKAVLEKARAEAFKGKAGECVKVVDRDGGRERAFVLVGLGKRKEAAGSERLRKAAGVLGKYSATRFKRLAVLPGPDAQAVAEGLLLSSYRFQEYRKREDEPVLTEWILAAEQAGRKAGIEAAVRKASLVSEAVCFTRDWVNRGPSDKSPESMGRLAESLSGSGVSVKLIDARAAQTLGMGSYLSVARGSSAPPCFVHLSYKPKGAKRKIGLVGKGITFDSGGLSLKPAQSMEDMKMDMAGAAAVLAVFKILPRWGVKAEVHGICAFTYNMPGPDATKPGDVVRAMNGKTIEVLNTDAEGRLVLADALYYASKQGLDAILDMATLTGAALIALGGSVTAAMSNNRPLLRRFMAAADRAGEKVWELPLVPEYKEGLKSDVADLRNISKARGEAGTIIGGLFLQEFVDGKPWIHLDIAGPAWTNNATEYCPPGATGAPVRALLEYLSGLN